MKLNSTVDEFFFDITTVDKTYSKRDAGMFCKILKTFFNCFKNKVKSGSNYE